MAVLLAKVYSKKQFMSMMDCDILYKDKMFTAFL